MQPAALPLIVLVSLTLLFCGWLMAEPLRMEYWRRRVCSRPFPEAWRRVLQQRVPYFRLLPADLQLQLKKRIQVFLAEKVFIGCAGQPITDEVRVTIAAHACLLILNRRTDVFPNLREILVYPSAFLVDRVQTMGAGVLQEQRRALAGESWSRGQVILSWEDTLAGAASIGDGHNVVIHEFAHQLDQETGQANGAPRLPGRRRLERWSRVMAAEFAVLQAEARQGQPSLLNHYGATDPAEFFAVASEVFFEQAHELADRHPALYRELSGFYCLNPLSW